MHLSLFEAMIGFQNFGEEAALLDSYSPYIRIFLFHKFCGSLISRIPCYAYMDSVFLLLLKCFKVLYFTNEGKIMTLQFLILDNLINFKKADQ